MSNKMLKEKKNQHYVPQGHLRKFTIKGEKSLIWSCDKIKAEFLRTTSSINKICSNNYYYYQVEDSGEINHTDFEDSLSEVEHAGILAIDKIINSSAMPHSHPGEKAQGELALYLALLLTRGPAFRDAVNDLHGLWAQQTLNQLYNDGELKDVPSELDKLIKEKGINNVITTSIYSYVSLQPMVEMANEIALTMLDKGWALYRAPHGQYFVTSDTPVAFGLTEHFPKTDIGPAHPFTEFTIPLSTILTLVISPAIEVGDSFIVNEATKNECTKINRRIISAANDFIFSPQKNDWIINLVKQVRKTRQGLSIQSEIKRSFNVIQNPFQSKRRTISR